MKDTGHQLSSSMQFLACLEVKASEQIIDQVCEIRSARNRLLHSINAIQEHVWMKLWAKYQ